MFSGTFFTEAEQALRACAKDKVHHFLSEPLEGKWHPNGFAVFDLGDVGDLGRLRLHVWPRGVRIALEGQPAIHSHPWDLCSLVIAGTYRDVLYEMREFANAAPDRLRGFHIRFGKSGEGDTVYPVDKWYAVTMRSEREITPGRCHYLAAGVLHESPIARDSFVATLLVTSQAVDLRKLLLVGDGRFGECMYSRPFVSVEHVAQIKAQLQRLDDAAC